MDLTGRRPSRLILAVAFCQAACAKNVDLAAFERLDRQARDLAFFTACIYQVRELSSEGAFGPPMTGRSPDCIVSSGRPIGVRYHADSAGLRAFDVSAVDIDSGKPYRAPIDTAALLARRRANADAIARSVARFDSAKRDFVAWPVWADGDSLTMWLLSGQVVGGNAVGGEVGYSYTRDGRTMVSTSDAFNSLRPLAKGERGPLVIESQQTELPLFSEMYVAAMVSIQGRSVTINTKRFTWVLVAREVTARDKFSFADLRTPGTWTHAARR